MANFQHKDYKDFLNKQEILINAKTHLKEEFIGIDNVIDEIIDALSSWYLIPSLQDKPVVINLWGLTGVGKTSLVNRLAQHLRFQDKYYHFNLGENETREWAIKRQLEEIYENINGYPIIIALDEFQHARTINEIGHELDKTTPRVIWQLLDSGKFQISKYCFHVEELYDLIQRLRFLLRNGVSVQNGKVVGRKDYFLKEMNLIEGYEAKKQPDFVQDDNDVYFVPANFYEGIFSLSKERYPSTFDIKSRLSKLNGYETIAFLTQVFSYGNSPKTVNCSKALIFVLGNLDEAYTMSHNFNPDMDPDEFHEQSLKITVPAIKKALKNRFRNEQIARLGNIHIIYPAFNNESFRRLINLELSRISYKVKSQHKVNIQFDSSIKELIFREGVYPTQGARPILTTIHQIISTKLGRVISEIVLQNINPDRVLYKDFNNKLRIEFLLRDEIIHIVNIDQKLELEELRKPKKDDIQAITGVHEAGHAIISSILLKTIPEVIFSNTAELENSGFIYTKFKWKYVSRKEIRNRLALFLAGYAAEKLIFGEDNVTSGAEEDIEKATEFITYMLKKCGMGTSQAAYHNKDIQTRFFLIDRKNLLNDEAESLLKSSLVLAEKTLKDQELLLLQVADYLSDNRILSKTQMKDMVKKYANNFEIELLIENEDDLFYRKHLKTQILKFRNFNEISSTTNIANVTLNKNSIS